MTIQEAFVLKADTVRKAFAELDVRSTPRIPMRLAWVVGGLRGESVNPAPGCCEIKSAYQSTRPPKDVPDRIARTFVLLEELEQWISRAAAGAARHQAEIERQANASIVRLQTYAALQGGGKETGATSH